MFDPLLTELEIFAFETLSTGHKKYKAPYGKHDDIIMAFALALWPLDYQFIEKEIKPEFIKRIQESYT